MCIVLGILKLFPNIFKLLFIYVGIVYNLSRSTGAPQFEYGYIFSVCKYSEETFKL